MRIYFAHPISDYGTSHETKIVEMIKRRDWEVENPNQPHHQQGYQDRGMDYFIDLCAGLDGCVYDTFPGGIIGAGVAKEVQSFLDAKKPVFCLSEFMGMMIFEQVTELNPDHIATRDTTRELSKLYRAIGRSL